MAASQHQPVFELTRGSTIESVHFGSIAVVDINDRLSAEFGDPEAVTFLRSSAKPFQLVPFLKAGAGEYFNLSLPEVAIMCASHSGTDEHLAVVSGLQEKLGVQEGELLCGTHFPYDEQTAERMRKAELQPRPNHHNCSGKHTGMLGTWKLLTSRDATLTCPYPYIDYKHPIQEQITHTVAQICGIAEASLELGIDGCSAPNFAMPLSRAAFGFARLCDPLSANIDEPSLVTACQTIISAMTSQPVLVAGPGKFDTRLMQVAAGRLISKGGAEGYQAIGLLPEALGPGSPAMGIAIKVTDGDRRGTARPAVTLEVLRQLGALSVDDLEALNEFGPEFPVRNWQNLEVGVARPCFKI